MFKRSRIFISAVLVAVLCVSTLILSNPLTARACPVDPPPATLLTLYLASDLIVVAEILSEKDGAVINDYADYFNLEVDRKLKPISTLKGTAPADFVFTKSEYRLKNNAPAESAEGDEEERRYTPYGYKGDSKLTAGEKYLFFFAKDSETGEYDLTDDVSGVKRLGDYDLEVHLKRLKELQSIQKLKKNQLEALTKWLIRCVEEPATRWDGVYDLRQSFDVLEYEKENAEEAEKPAEKESRAEDFKLDENFSNRSAGAIAKNLTDKQKERLSNIAFSELQQDSSLIENDYFYYSLPGLVTRWDKTRFAMYAFGMLQSVDPNDAEKMRAAMRYLSDIVDDDELTEIAARFPTSEEEAEEIQKNAQSDDAEKTVESVNNLPEAPTTDAQNTENKTETPDQEALPKPKRLTAAEIRSNRLQEFVNRYQYLVANNFEVEETDSSSPELAVN